jgi:peptide subunit release factor 1 (eRF1)
VAARVVEQMHLDIRAPEHEVMRATLEAFRRYDARTDADKVRQATDAYRAGGLGVAGAGAAWMALQIGQVDELLVPADPSLLRVTDDDIALAGEEAVRLTVEELATQARRTDARVSVIEDAGLLRDVGGVAGLLRYRVTPRWQGPIPT